MKTSIKALLNIIITITAAALVFAACGDTGQNTNPPQNQPGQQTPQIQQPKSDNIKAGMYKVGTDLPAGEYILYGDGNMAYFQVSKDSTGTIESIISNDNFSGTRYITVADGQYLEFRSSYALPEVKAPVQQPKDGKFENGMYKVGKDIKAGEYKVVSSGGLAYFEVRKNSSGSLEGIVSNDNFEGEKYVTVKDGQYIKLNGSYIQAK